MTVIVGVDYGSEILVLGDTRVSYGEGPQAPPPRDRLRKLVSIDYQQRRALLGFSGDIASIQQILIYIRLKAKHAASSGSLKSDFQKWLKEPILRRPIKRSLRFMLCDFDPSDEAHLHVFRRTPEGEVEPQPDRIQEFPGGVRVAIIGSGSKFERQIHQAALHAFGSPEAYRDFEAYSRVRTLMTDAVLSSWFQDQALNDIGGPSTIFRIRPDGAIGPQYTLPLGDDSPDVRVTEDGKRTVLYSPSTNKEFTLFSIFAFTDADFAREDACAGPMRIRANSLPALQQVAKGPRVSILTCPLCLREQPSR